MRTTRHPACIILAAAAALTATAAVCAPPKTANRQWRLRYTEDFNGKGLNTKLWTRIQGDPDSGADWIKNISTRPDLVEVKNGVLILKGVKNNDRASDPRSVLAGGVSTQGLFNMKYGKVEVRVKFEGQKGAWPAIWMMPQNRVGAWPLCGEIDILERLNFDGFVYQTVHSAWTQHHPDEPPHGRKGAIDANGWNVYALEWTPDKIVWRVNGKETHSYPKVDESQERWPWNVPFYLMIDMQLGGRWVGGVDESTLPVAMYVDWVKFYELATNGKRTSVFTRPKH